MPEWLEALAAIDTVAALDNAKSLSGTHLKGALSDAVTNVLFNYSDEKDFDSLSNRFTKLPFGNEKFMVLQTFANFVKRIKDPSDFKKGVDMIVSFRDTIPAQYRQMMNPYFNGMILNGIASAKQSKGMTEQADYVKSKLPAKVKSASSVAVPADTLRKYTGTYDYNGENAQITLEEDQTLFMKIADEPEMELVPVSQNKFTVRYMNGYSIEFHVNDKNEVIDLVLKSPDEEVKAVKKE